MRGDLAPFKIGDMVKHYMYPDRLLRVSSIFALEGEPDPDLWNFTAELFGGEQGVFYSEDYVKVIDYNNIWNIL